MKAVKANVKFEKENRQNSYKPACLQKNFHGRALSIRAFSADGHYALIVSLHR